MGARALRVRPIDPDDTAGVANFLHHHLNRRLTPATWAAAMRSPWPGTPPNQGFTLGDDEGIVGVNLAFYSVRELQEGPRSFCNMAALAVLPEHRVHAFRLVRALIAQPGYTFTDLSPSGQVVEIDRRLGFRPLDTTTAVSLNVPGRGSRGTDLLVGAEAVGEVLTGAGPRRLLEDHRHALAVQHLLLVRGARQCYVMLRRDRRKRLPIFGTLLHVSDPDLYLAARPLVDRWLVRQGALGTLVELRVLGGRAPARSRLFEGRPKMVRSSSVSPVDVDDLYSELTCVPW